jgi:hypothetical protein
MLHQFLLACGCEELKFEEIFRMRRLHSRSLVEILADPEAAALWNNQSINQSDD